MVFLLVIFVKSWASPVFISVEENSDTVMKYEKFELLITLTADYFNPYDFNQINLKCKFIAPSGAEYTVDGFYFQDYIMTQPDVLVLSGNPDWRVRFAPSETGIWSYLLSCTDIYGYTEYPVQQFTCLDADNPGFIRQVAGTKFKFDNGQVFLGLGINLAWVEWANGFTVYNDWIESLSGNGGNFAKITLAPWSFGLEWAETGAGNYTGRQNRAWALDWVFEKLIENGIYCQFNFMVHDELRPENSPGWLQNPYNNQNGGPCHEPQNFLVNDDAKALYMRKIRYMIARWGWTPYVQSWEILSEVDNTGLYSDFGSQTLAWINQMTSYTRETDIYKRPVSCGFAIPEHDPVYWNDINVGFTQQHIYDFIPDLELKLYNFSQWYLETYQKPTLIGEFSLGHDPNELIQKDPSGISFHNSLWATALSGSVSTALSWWWNNYIYANGLFAHFAPISNFFNQVGFTVGDLEPEILLAKADINESLEVAPDFYQALQKAPENTFLVEPNGSVIPNELNLGQVLYGSFFGGSRNPPTFHVNYTKPGEFTVHTGGVASFSKIKIKLDGTTIINQSASTNSNYTINVPVGEHQIFVENSGSGLLELSHYEFFNYAPVLRTFTLRNNNHVVGWMQNKKYNWEYVMNNGIPPSTTGGTFQVDNFDQGVYKIYWHDSSGDFDSVTEVLHQGGDLVVNAPDILWDGAFMIDYFAALSIDFTADVTTGDAPLEVQFSDISFNGGFQIESWHWNFGDGSTGATQNPAHIYSSPGVYSVSLKVMSGTFTDSIVKTNFINVLQPLIAEFMGHDTTILAGKYVHYIDLSLGSPTSWNWDFGDNSFSTSKFPSHLYSDPGYYTVSLTIHKNTQSDTEIKTDYIHVFPPVIADFSSDTVVALPDEDIHFFDLSQGEPITWLWDFGNGVTSSAQNPVHGFDETGLYSVQLTVGNEVASDSVLKENYIVIIETLVAGFFADTTLSLAGDTIRFSDISSGIPDSWFWEFGDGITSTIQNPEVQYQNPGIYSIKLTVSNNYFTDSITRQEYISVLPPVQAAFSADDTVIIAGNTVHFTDQSVGSPENWYWDFGNSTVSNLQHPAHLYPDPGNFTVSLIASNAYSTDTSVRNAYIKVLEPLVADFIADTTFAWTGQPINFTDLTTGNPTSWWWSFGDQYVSHLQHPQHSYSYEGTYTVGLVVLNEYQDDSEFKTNYITIMEPLIANFGVDTSYLVVGQTAHFENLSTGNPVTWNWNFGDGGTASAINPSHTYSATGDFTVTLTIYKGDSSNTMIKENFIHVRDSLVAGFSAGPLEVHANEKVYFYDQSTGNPTSWQWDFGEIKYSTLQNPVYTYKIQGFYDIRLIVGNGFDTDTLVKEDLIHVLPPIISQAIYIPEGWSGISTYIQPFSNDIETIFETVADHLYFASNNSGIYWPSQGINTITNWNPYEGLVVKMTAPVTLEISGTDELDKISELKAGWNVLPVLSACPEACMLMFGEIADTLTIIKEIAGSGVYWPGPGVFSLDYLLPGRSYYALVNYDVDIKFHTCENDFKYDYNTVTPLQDSPWNEIENTSSSHTIALYKSAFSVNNISFNKGDILGVFTLQGYCAGLVVLDGNFIDNLLGSISITAFGKYQATDNLPGFIGDEKMDFRLYRHQDNQTLNLEAVFDDNYPQKGNFRFNGLSAAKTFKLENSMPDSFGVTIFPNPGDGNFRVQFHCISAPVPYEVLTMEGEILVSG
nr:PKD domain-containing protein [Bacteroidota bacterium]